LIVSSNFVGRSTGSSSGLAPLSPHPPDDALILATAGAIQI
jgi:hypothetical protein